MRGGVHLAVHLGKLLTREERSRVEVTLVSRDNNILFHPLLPELTGSLAAFAHGRREQRGVEIRLGAGLRAVGADAVWVRDRSGHEMTLSTRTVVATVPAGPHLLLTALPFPQEKGRMVVVAHTEVVDWPRPRPSPTCPSPRGHEGQPVLAHLIHESPP